MSRDRTSNPRKRRAGVDHVEEKAWVGFYRRAGDPVIAAEIVRELQLDPEMKRTHLALYLRCKESLRADKARVARNRRIGQFVRTLCSSFFVAPAQAVLRMMRQSTAVAIECLPETNAEPAAQQVRKLTSEAEFAQEQSTFAAALPERDARSSVAKLA